MDSFLKLNILTPNRSFFNGNVVNIKTEDMKGPIDLLPNFMSATIMLKSSFTRFTDTDGKEYGAFIGEGFMKIRNNVVTIICRAAEWPEEIDIQRAEEAKKRAEQRLQNTEGIDISRAEKSLHRALSRLKIKETRIND